MIAWELVYVVVRGLLSVCRCLDAQLPSRLSFDVSVFFQKEEANEREIYRYVDVEGIPICMKDIKCGWEKKERILVVSL